MLKIIDKIKNKTLPDLLFWAFVVVVTIWVIYLDILSTHFFMKIVSSLKELDTNTIAILLATSGWLVALILQNQNTKNQLKAEIKYDIYKQLVFLHKEAQDSLSKLLSKTLTPFIMMECSMIPFNCKSKKEVSGEWILYSETECLLDGWKQWNKYINDLNNAYFDFNDKYLSILYVLDDWMAPIKKLEQARAVFREEVKNILDGSYVKIKKLQEYSTCHDFDWRKLNRDEITKIADEINEGLHNVGCYLIDFMTLIHNELLFEYFRYTKRTRKTLDEKYKVLTKKGLVVNLETDKKLIEKYEKIISKNVKK